MNEILHGAARIGAAGGFAEMGAACQWASVVNKAAQGGAIEQRTAAGVIVIFSQLGASARAQGIRHQQCFAAREKGSLAREFELAAITATLARAFDRALREFAVEGGDFCAQLAHPRWIWMTFRHEDQAACPAAWPEAHAH